MKQLTAWLIETVEQPARYFVAAGDWCDNPNHAHKFPTRQEAEQVQMGMVRPENMRVTEHLWAAPAPTKEQEKAK